MTQNTMSRSIALKPCILFLSIALCHAASPTLPEVDAAFAQVGANASPGCAVSVVRDGVLIHSKGYGLADLEHNVSLTPQSRFYMASLSKQFTAMAVLLAAEAGKLSLDDSIRKTIPELPAYMDGVTLRHLLHHTSGVRDYLMLGMLMGHSPDYVYTDHEALRMIARQKALNFEPGSEHLYSNSGYVLLSIVIQRATGKNLDDWARETIFSPLGMNATRFQHSHAALVPDRAVGFTQRGRDWMLANSMLDVVGDGGLYSSAEDMAKWAANFDHPKIGTTALTLMQRPASLTAGPNSGKEIAYGMGLFPWKYRGLAVVSHGGSLAGYRTMLLRFPTERLTIICLCNSGNANPNQLSLSVADKILGAKFSEPKPDPPKSPSDTPPHGPVIAEDRVAGIGSYWSDELQTTYRLLANGENLLIEVGDQAPQPLGGDGPGKLAMADIQLTLERAESGPAQGIVLNAGRIRGIRFVRRP
jgi:CubicO group peptidase (beta-lactamase class C family)